MAELPDLILAVQLGPGPGSVLVAHRQPDGRIQAGIARWPAAIPAGTLFLHWPRELRWEPEFLRLRSAVREEGGEAVPLAAVLDRLGLGSPRTPEGVMRALAPEIEAVEDPALLGRRLMTSLAERLATFDAPLEVAAVPPRSFAPPALADAMLALPQGPGVYVFRGAEKEALYVGKAASLRARVPQHFDPRAPQRLKGESLAARAVSLEWEETGSELEALLREQLRIRREHPRLNVQEAVHERPRGAWRDQVVALVLPSVDGGSAEICLVAGDGRFHWERVRRGGRLPRGLWTRLRGFLEGPFPGWAPGESGADLGKPETAALAEITLSWLARHGDRVSRIDLRTEILGRGLQTRLRWLLRVDPSGERVEVRAPGRRDGEV